MFQEAMDIALSLSVLTILEVILGIDNLVFLSIITQKLPTEQRKFARRLGLTLAWVTRLLLLASAVWLSKLTAPLFTFFSHGFSGRDLFLIGGGAFLLAKATQEIHSEIEPEREVSTAQKLKQGVFLVVVSQVALLDIIFSLDSVLTAIGLTDRFWLMAVAITIAIITMIFTSEPLAKFIEKHPTIKMLALSFLILIGMVLVADGFDFHIPRGYVYFALGFSLLIEMLNMARKKRRSI